MSGNLDPPTGRIPNLLHGYYSTNPAPLSASGDASPRRPPWKHERAGFVSVCSDGCTSHGLEVRGRDPRANCLIDNSLRPGISFRYKDLVSFTSDKRPFMIINLLAGAITGFIVSVPPLGPVAFAMISMFLAAVAQFACAM